MIPAILPEAVAKIVRTLQDTDPQDSFTIKVEWTDRGLTRPLYGLEESNADV